jgi:hypothetical protein
MEKRDSPIIITLAIVITLAGFVGLVLKLIDSGGFIVIAWILVCAVIWSAIFNRKK